MARRLYLAFLLVVLRSAVACNENDVRLYNGSSTVKGDGMLQICSGGQWVAVCDYRWSRGHSIVACKALGYSNPNPIAYLDSGNWSHLGFVGTYYCNNQSGSLFSCLTNNSYYLNSYYYQDYYCNNNRDTVSLQCNIDTSGCTYKAFRLYNGTANSSGNYGMLQICDSTGHWTAVCDYDWSCYNALAACNALGYNDSRPTYSVNGGPWTKIGFGPYYCYYTQSSLFNCYQYSSYYRQSTYYCNPYKDTVMLKCSEPSTTFSCSIQYQVRLVNGKSNSSSEGRIEICYNQKWRTICQSSYYYYYSSYERFASTVCNQLGFTSTPFAKIITDGRFGTGLSDLYMSIPYCSHTYTNIRYCSIYNYGYSQCSSYSCQYNRLGLKCYESGDCNEGDVRLVNGTVVGEGRVEVCAMGVWGRVCAQNFRKSAARIACLQNHIDEVEGAVIDSYGKYGIGNNPIVYSNVDCFGHEKSLAQCSKTVYPNFTCADNNIIGLLCLDNCSDGDVRLVGGRNKFQGTVEICLDHSWCLVSQHGWDNRDARVVCRQLVGYNPSTVEAVFNSSFGKPKRSVRYSNVNCYGNEEKLSDCLHHTLEFDVGATYMNKTAVAGVDCNVISSSSQITSTSLPKSSSQPQNNVKTSSVLPIPSISIQGYSSQPQHYVEKSSKIQSTLILKSSSQPQNHIKMSSSSKIQSISSPKLSTQPQHYVRVSSAYQMSSSIIPKPSLKPLSQNDNNKGVFISSLLVLAIAVCILALGIVLMICGIARIQRLFKKGHHHDEQQMSTLQRGDQYEDSKLNFEDDEEDNRESPPLSSEDENLLKM